MPSVFVTANQLIPLVKDSEGQIQTEPFLNVARQVLPLIDHLGSAFYLVKYDISGNIERLAGRAHTDPNKYRSLFSIIKDEIDTGEYVKPLSCAKGLLWLKRAMEFILVLLERFQQDEDMSLYDAAYKAYLECLQPFHGMMTRGVFTVALNVVPTRQAFMKHLGSPEDAKDGMKTLLEQWKPLIQEIHTFMIDNDLNDPTRV